MVVLGRVIGLSRFCESGGLVVVVQGGVAILIPAASPHAGIASKGVVLEFPPVLRLGTYLVIWSRSGVFSSTYSECFAMFGLFGDALMDRG